jgi:hypothetical protein
MPAVSHFVSLTTETGDELLTEAGDYLITGYTSPGRSLSASVTAAGDGTIVAMSANHRTMSVDVANVRTMEVYP